MKSLQQYRIDAIKILQKAKSRWVRIHITDELVTDVVTALADADNKFCPNSGLSAYKWRRYKAICAIKTHVREYRRLQKYKAGTIDLNNFLRGKILPRTAPPYNDKVGRRVDFLLRNAGLTTSQRKFIDAYLQHGEIDTACEQSGITYKEGASLWDAAIKKFKRVALHA